MLHRHIAFAAAGIIAVSLASGASAAEWKVASKHVATGFGHNESVAWDAKEKVFYTGDFGPALKPGEKDGKGSITKVAADGTILQKHVFPAEGETMNKPKGIWIDGDNLWVADIDAVWQFNIRSKKGKRLALPIGYANDTAVMGGALYISDNQHDTIVRIQPADFLDARDAPKIDTVYSGKDIHPNGIWPAKDGSLLMVGYVNKDHPKGIYTMKPGAEPKEISKDMGVLDGLYQTDDGEIIATDWVTTSLFAWDEKTGMRKLADGIKGPADFAAVPNDKGVLIALPDLVKGEIVFVQLSKQ